MKIIHDFNIFNKAPYLFWIYGEIIEPRHEKTNILVSDLVWHKPAVQPHKMARGLKFRI